jgi:hypothetical protein
LAAAAVLSTLSGLADVTVEVAEGTAGDFAHPARTAAPTMASPANATAAARTGRLVRAGCRFRPPGMVLSGVMAILAFRKADTWGAS